MAADSETVAPELHSADGAKSETCASEHVCCGQSHSQDGFGAVPQDGAGRSFQIRGLDCAEEVAILNKVIGPKVGGAEHLAFDVINGRMIILDSAAALSDGEITQLVATTGMSAKPWDAENAFDNQGRFRGGDSIWDGIAVGCHCRRCWRVTAGVCKCAQTSKRTPRRVATPSR